MIEDRELHLETVDRLSEASDQSDRTGEEHQEDEGPELLVLLHLLPRVVLPDAIQHSIEAEEGDEDDAEIAEDDECVSHAGILASPDDNHGEQKRTSCKQEPVFPGH